MSPLSEPEDDFLEGWDIYDGTRYGADPNNPHSYITFLELADEAFPGNGHSDPQCHFDLDPSNNCLYQVVNDRRLNYNSIEIYEGEEDEILENLGLITTITPEGNRSIRINNGYNRNHVNTIRRTFDVDSCDQFLTFSYAMVMENPEKHGEGNVINTQPFFGAYLSTGTLSNPTILDRRVYIADINNPCFEVQPAPLTPIVL